MYFSYLITCIDVPDKARNIEELTSYLTYFEKMKSMRYGVLSPDELHIRDKFRETEVEKAIRRGLDDHNLYVYYQPICTAGEQKFITAEALIRLIDPEMGFISPAEFIPVAEHSGLMIPVGNYVLDEVCRFISTHDMEQLGLKYIEVNLSVVQCLQRDFLAYVDHTVQKYQVDTKYLCFEITETASNCAPEIFTSNLQQLVDRGYKLALDDFGTGYGNLQRMVNTNFHIVKFDKDMTQQACSTTALKAAFGKLVPLFRSMGLELVAEGVETEEQYSFLTQVGIDYIQGYYFSKPVPETEFLEFLKAHKS